ncbi:hypothetical protein [Haloechinothrix salitolerans]|uniref:MYXO-CTERM domain-containing protein n=1 Tax=Haloechinothrix salitolerans TaxID=926830 RepID=A0ABW2C993_9PSEU
MTKLRGVALTLVFGGIAAALVPAFGLAGAPEVPVVGEPVAAVATTTDTKASADKPKQADNANQAAQRRKQPTASPSPAAQGEQEPNINERKKQADDERRKNKLVVGGVAVVLLLIVVWGRKVRSKRRNAGS